MKLVCLAALTALAACTPPRAGAPTEAAAPAAAAPAPSATYSPFAVILDAADAPAHAITFKDVGLRLAPAQAAVVHEALAEAVAARLQAHAARAVHDPTVADPAWHTQCASAHRYVDVWRSDAPARVGFSIWAGCGSDDRLAWAERPLAGPTALDGPDMLSAVEDVAAAIATAIAPCPHAPCG